MPVYPLKSRVETDALSVLVYSDDDVLSNQNHLLFQGQLGAHALGQHVPQTRTSPTQPQTVNITLPAKTMGTPFKLPRPRQKNQRVHSEVEGYNLQSRNFRNCITLKRNRSGQTSSVFAVNYKPSERPHYRPRGGEPICLAQVSPNKEGFFSHLFLVPQKGWNFSTGNGFTFSEQLCGELAFSDGDHLV